MNSFMKYAAAALAGAAAAGSIAYAQSASAPRAVISIYRAAPGHQEALLQWLAQQDRIAVSAGVPSSQLYAHTDGDSWDYLMISPVTTDAQDAAIEAAAAKAGMPTGPKVGLELRKHIASHTDTMVVGPLTPAQMVDRYK
ncbi:hypothetical protein [Sphingomonas daechungensis]|uniref:hypothetical protein n=1 Tax=Sphingomonas daechungensis TaxID=1176646 RepID=UPI00378353A7